MARETSLATIWLVMVQMMKSQGMDVAPVLKDIGVAESILCQPGVRLPSRLTDVVFERALRLIDNPAFGLQAAHSWHPSNLGTLGYAWLSSSTLRTGLLRMERYSKILGNRFTYTCVDQPDGLRFIYDHGRGNTPVGWAIADFALSIFIDMCRTNYGEKLVPLRICLRRPRPADAAPYFDFFGGEVRFAQDEDSFLIDRATVDTALPSANKLLAATFDRILTTQLGELVAEDLVTRCRAHLLQHLTSGEPSEADTARALGLSRRSMQRRLNEQGWSYKRVVDDTRAELARRYLADPAKSLTEIAFLLGFSEQSAFSRAFRRWRGESPTAHRSRLFKPEKAAPIHAPH